MDNNNKQLQSRSSNMQSIGSNADSVMPTWVYWKHHTKQIIDLFGSIFHANMVGLGNNFEYMHNDSYEYKQPSESYKSDKPYESELSDLKSHQCTRHPNRRCTCAPGECIDDRVDNYFGSISRLELDKLQLELNDIVKLEQ
jgi:hypothetical protein